MSSKNQITQTDFVDLLLQGVRQSFPFLTISQEQLDQFAHYYDLLCRWNAKMNLTAHRDLLSCCEKNFIDSFSLASCVESNAQVMDIGSGAGFPALVLKILFPEILLTAFEANAKKRAFLAALIRELGLKEACVESAPLSLVAYPHYFNRFDLIVSRATFSLDELVLFAQSFLKEEGRLLAMLAQIPSEGFGALPLYLQKLVPYRLPFSNLERYVAVFKKDNAVQV